MNRFDKILEKIRATEAVQKYLSIATQKIRSKQLKKQIEAEVLSHIESYVEEQIKTGISIEQAVADALLNFGDVNSIRSGFYEANKPFYLRKSFYIPISAAVLLGVGFISALEIYGSNAQKLLASRIQTMQRALSSVLSDQKRIEHLNIFENQVSGLDYGIVANERLTWNIDDMRSAENPFYVSQVTMDKLNGRGEEWLISSEQVNIQEVDVSWLSDLHRFAYWDLYNSGPAKNFSSYSKGNPFSVPVPNYLHFKGFARVALLKGIQQKRLPEVLTEVEHLARLLYTNETLIGGIIALSLLEDNITAAAFGKKHGLATGKDLPYSLADIERFQKILRARADYFDFINSADTLASVFSLNEDQNSSPGYCHGLDEGIKAMTLYHRFFNGSYPYESDYKKSIAYIDSVMEKSVKTCRIAPARFFWKERDNTPDLSAALHVSMDPAQNTVLRIASKIPYLREKVGRMLLAKARPVFSEY